jgi:hypothetical protein
MFDTQALLKRLKGWSGPTEFLRVDLPSSFTGYTGVKLGEAHAAYIHKATTRPLSKRLMYLNNLEQSVGLELVIHDSVTAITDVYLAGLLAKEINDFPESGLLKKMVRFKHPDPAVVERANRCLLMMYVQLNKFNSTMNSSTQSRAVLFQQSLE